MNRQHPPLPDPSTITWTVSSYSGGGGNCVQAAPHPDAAGFILLGDSKRPDQLPLTVRRDTWRTYLQAAAQ
ncbi:DUF397 domain-containing protein [Streptomyces yaizuensis]|uniref:DUF397 domain-containing protein n=1 Tax=Streptomyces yaizuensis TaxID=2989713 RepID=A0ABQ5P6P4_9ACTN|nr:DUF397 domain-containing protein [Streptomyces sp. YSPA8]GLF98150.1 DUF397 domain-containing protein [Streptomyces sp. YSPA8]